MRNLSFSKNSKRFAVRSFIDFCVEMSKFLGRWDEVLDRDLELVNVK